ncbi:MAG TPA: hypothetical protein VFS00_20390, partial [Polyangiaceae bacterium]|nr:hypothetical protein [Polyangiaceae bacterium]
MSTFFGAALLLAGCAAEPAYDGAVGAPSPNDQGAGGSGGGNSAGGGLGGGGGASPVIDWGVPASPVGSFDVRFLETKSDGSGPKLVRAPSQDALLRIDFPTDCGGAGGSSAAATPCVLRPDWQGKVLVTVQGSAPTAYDVTREDRALVLETDSNRAYVEGAIPVAIAAGAGGADGQGTTYFTTDRWQRFSFPLDAQGRVVPPVQVQGVQYIDNGQQAAGVKLSANASLHADRTAPRAEMVVGSSFSPPGLQFPWDPLSLRFDEPVVLPEPGEVVVATPADGAASAPLLWRWSPQESSAPVSLLEAFGATLYQGYWRGWDTTPLDSTVRLGAFFDPSKNPGVGFVRELKLTAPAPSAAAAQDFEGEPGVVLWGGAAFEAAGCEPSASADLANARCVRFTFQNAPCGLTEPA